ncbi:hypothetical protein CABS01_03080 [Colletotrichum abscissum]|uniref:Chromo domain-containing protein n=1 Tax=Colletotrichum abscissum TaxID=1671311 RepID=A0A9P9X7T8_9PEZI|nr:uncharacterized protein CABS01_03080 [Colletotrichum abscissum]KAI3541375.1 hypothetical protein CABS02_10769 [Colletotrichum abscissum]KAK1477778.1 hypothetical protein CABS01_03080 [Colletotrichum abscissum]
MGLRSTIVSKLVSGHNGNTKINLNNGTDEHFTRLMNSALEERHILPRWTYDEPEVDATILEVNFAQPCKRTRSTWPSDYHFQSIHPRRPSVTPNVAVHTDLANLARRFDIPINALHNFMRFPPVRAIVRTLLIELEHPDAQSSPQLDEVAILDRVDDIVSNTDPSDRRMYLNQVTSPGPQFADRALILCLVKLCAQFEGWNRWAFGSRRSTIQVFMGVVGLFCNAWVKAPTVDASWSRAGASSLPSFLSSKRFGVCESETPSPQSRLTPEIWFDWSLLFDPWLRQTNAIQLLNPESISVPLSPFPDCHTRHEAIVVTDITQPEPEKQGRVVVKYHDITKPDEERWAFRSILDSRWSGSGKTPRTGLQYLVEWEYAEPTWQPARDLQGCDSWVLQFHRENPGRAGPVARLRRAL